MGSTTKENDGRGRRRLLAKRIALILTFFSVVLLSTFLIKSSSSTTTTSSANNRTPLFQHGGGGGRHLKGRQHQRQQQRGGDGRGNNNKEDQILSGHLHLVNLHIANPMEVEQDDVGSYDGIYGEFCHLDWDLHKQDPSGHPMFRDLVNNSPDCDEDGRGGRVRVNLRDITEQAREYDNSSQEGQPAHPLEIGGVVFHESRCGSTLTANLLAAVYPEQHRVYSESTPPLQAMKQVCGENYEHCNMETAASALKDVMYMMSRSDDPNEKRVYFKIQSAGSKNIDVFQTAFPDTPYLFVYRDPVQVMMSHLKMGYRNANCLRGRQRPPELVEDIADRFVQTRARRLSPEEYCAAHLASITETVVTHMTKYGTPVNYEDLPQALYHDIFPNNFGIHPIDEQAMKRMDAVAAIYSKGRGKKAGQEFQGDSEQKEEMASDEVREAAETFLSESYHVLEELADKRKKK